MKFDDNKLRKQRVSPEVTQLGCFLVYMQANLPPIMGLHVPGAENRVVEMMVLASQAPGLVGV